MTHDFLPIKAIDHIEMYAGNAKQAAHFYRTGFGFAQAANLASYESSMPAYEGVLSDDEIVAALSWIKSQWPASIRVKHDEMNRSSSQQR